MNASEKIKKRRLELHLSMQDLADLIGVNKTCIFKWETQSASNMKYNNLIKLSEALKVSPMWFVENTDDITPFLTDDKEKPTDDEIENEIIKMISKMNTREKLKIYHECMKIMDNRG